MKRIVNKDIKCSFCRNDEEEDMILLVKVLYDCVEGFEYWHTEVSSDQTENVQIKENICSELREIFKLKNFSRIMNDLFIAKYPDIENCHHSSYVE